jgi:hypothetical protein
MGSGTTFASNYRGATNWLSMPVVVDMGYDE